MRRSIRVTPNTPMVRMGGRPAKPLGVLLISQLAAFLLYAFADGPTWINQNLLLTAGQAFGALHLWQLGTATLIHLRANSILFNLGSQWLFGAPLLRHWGAKRFLLVWWMAATVGTFAGAVGGLASPERLVGGSAGASAGLMVAFSFLFPRHLLFLSGVWPLRGRWLPLLIWGFILVGTLMAEAWLEAIVHVGGALVVLLWLNIPRRAKRRKEHLKVLDGRGERTHGGSRGGGASDPRWLN